MKRRQVLKCALAVAAALAVPAGAYAQQEYPSRDIHVVCAFPPGSGADVLVRHFAEKLRPITKRNIIVENRAGAGGNIATEYVARSKPDGYTIYIHAPSALAANMHLFKKPPVDAAKACKFGILEAGNRSENTDLLAVLQLGLEADHVP